MADAIDFYTNPMSRGRIVRWMLEETGASYRDHVIPFGLAMKSREYRAINPMGKVPAIVHKGVVVTEVPAILAYLADAFPAAGLAPDPSSPARGEYYRWLFFAAGSLEYAALNKSFGFEVPKEGRGRMGYGTLERVLATLEAAVKARDFLAGGRFSAADIQAGSALAWNMMMGTIDKRPAFEAYVNRLTARPAAVKARAIDDALAAEMQKTVQDKPKD